MFRVDRRNKLNFEIIVINSSCNEQVIVFIIKKKDYYEKEIDFINLKCVCLNILFFGWVLKCIWLKIERIVRLS